MPIINFLIKMEVHNNFSPLAFRKKESKATYEKWYAFGKNYAIPASANTLIPFQFTELNIPVFNPDTIEVEVINEETGESKKTGVYVSFDVMPEHGGVLYVSPGKNSFREDLPQGTYRARFTIGNEVYISTPFCVIPGIETSSKYLLIEYWNDEKIAYPGGFITTGANNDFRYQMYVPATICKPKYEFEEELTKRAGYKFLELQTSTKVYAFTFVAPEFICDAMRLIRLSDYIRISHDGEYYNALNFEFDVDWQEQLYLAAVDCQFETDSIIQKLPSFNRRDKASFYNALLANIDTPIMFSPDTVGLYYKEYRETEPVVKGKLIRELSPIDLIDENTTIAVDLGTGEARKFNLYRMLQDYISKTHEDATDFLLHLRGGATFGEGITGSAASINEVGDAEVQGLNARVTKVKSLDSEDYVTVNKTAFTVNKQGDTALNALNARGDSHLQQDVYTGNNTGKITKEGQLQYLSAVIQEFITSPTFVPGFLGEGFKIWVENGNWYIECDNLTVRQTMNIFELLIQKIRSVNGALVVSQSNGKIKSVSEDETNYVITMEEEGETFQPNDLVRCQVWTGSKTKFYWVEVSSVSGNSITVKKSEFTAGNKPEKGDEVVQMGNTQDAQRQALIYITAQESGHPYIEILNGVKTKSLSGTNRTRLGDLSNIQDSAFPKGQQPSGSGLYCDNAFLRGIFLLRNGKSVENEVNQAKQDAANAATEAERAQQTAQEAKDRLNKWADDGFISPTEKPALIDEGKRIQAEFLQIKNNADKYGVSVTEYTKAYEDYLNELRCHSAQQPEDIAVRPELAQSQTAYYNKRNGALNAIATASKDYVDNADKQLKEYLDTEITATSGKIELAVRSLKVADVNLLKGAYKELKDAAYGLGAYSYDVPVINGKEYTLTVCYTLSANNTHIEAYANGGTNFLTNFTTKGGKVVESKKVTMVGYKPTEGFFFYQFPRGTYGSKVHWAVLTDGNLGVTSWIPSASERRVGIRNLFPVSRMKAVTNQQLNYFDVSGWVTTIYDESEFKSRFKPSTTYTITGKYTILGKPAAGTGYKDHLVAFCMYDNTTIIDLWRKYVGDETVGTTGGISNTFTTPSNLDGYHIVVYTMYNSGNLGEIRFTDLMVSEGINEVGWSQAPEDALTESIKYTDTQISAIDGKIELSVTTKVNQMGVGGDNLVRYYSDTLVSYPPYNSTPIVKDSYTFETTWNSSNTSGVLTIANKRISAGQIPNFCYRFRMLINGVPATKDRISDKRLTTYAASGEMYYDGDGYFYGFVKGNRGVWFIHAVTTGIKGGNVIRIENFIVATGTVCPGFSPASADISFLNERFTQSKIDIVEGKIELKVSSTTYEDGIKRVDSISRMLSNAQMLDRYTDVNFSNGTNGIGSYDNSGSGQVKLDVIDNDEAPNSTHKVLRVRSAGTATTPGAGGFTYTAPSDKNRVLIFRFTAKLEEGKLIEWASNMAGEGYTCEWLTPNYGTGKWEEYILAVYCGSSGTFSSTGYFYIAQRGAYEMLISYASAFMYSGDNAFVGKKTYETKITQLDQSISLKASQSDLSATTERVRKAEIKLDSTSVKLGVVEGTANSANTAAGKAQSTANAANSLASTANSKAEAADGRVTATQNGLVKTGINITSRKIVLKSDNVLFQNNAGQQIAAINANGKLTANAIEVGEVVAGGFAAQRITTGNLTVTDGAVIGGMTITGGVLTGKNINIRDGAKIGNFTIVSGIFSAQNTPAGIQMTLSNNAATFDSSGVRVENNSGGYALTTTGNGRIFLTGSNFWVQCKDVDFMGAQTWKAPGVFYACVILGSGAIGATWGNPDFHIKRVVLNSAGRYTVYTSGGQVGNYFVMVQGYDASLWLSTTVELYSAGEFTYKVFDVNKGMINAAVIIYFCGMVS